MDPISFRQEKNKSKTLHRCEISHKLIKQGAATTNESSQITRLGLADYNPPGMTPVP